MYIINLWWYFAMLAVVTTFTCKDNGACSAAEKRRVIIDTDAGIDDTFAILALLSNDDVSVEAITCATGNTDVDNVVTNVKRILTLVNRTDIPVYKGATHTLSETPEILLSQDYFGSDGFGNAGRKFNVSSNVPNQKEEAFRALLNLVKKSPNEITIISIAPLTNIALAIRADKAFANNVKEHFIMGGNYQGIGNVLSGSEFNFAVDPEAAYDVLIKMKSPITVVPLETTTKNTITMDQFKILQTSKCSVSKLFTEFYNFVTSKGYQDNASKTFDFLTDGIAAAVFLKPNIITGSFMRRLSVEKEGSQTFGQLLQAWTSDMLPEAWKNSTVVTNINRNKMFTKVFKPILENCFSSNFHSSDQKK